MHDGEPRKNDFSRSWTMTAPLFLIEVEPKTSHKSLEIRMVVVRAACFTSSVVLLLSITGVGPAARADTLGVEAYLAALLDVPRDADHVSVVQTRHDAYAATLNLMDLMKAMKIAPDRLTSPGKITFDLKNEKQDIWRIAGQGQYFASTKRKDGKQSTSMVTNIDRFDVSGQFDYGHESSLLLTTRGGHIQQVSTQLGERDFHFERSAFYVAESPEISGRSVLKSRIAFDTVTTSQTEHNQAPSSLEFSSFEVRTKASALTLQPVKGMIRYGDRLEFHASEGEAMFPEGAVADMGAGNVELEVSAMRYTDGAAGVGGFSKLRVGLSGDRFTKIRRHNLTMTIDALWFQDLAGRLDRFVPNRVTLSASLEDVSSQIILLSTNPAFSIGVNNRWKFVWANLAPSNSIKLNNIKVALENPNYKFEGTGFLVYNTKTRSISDLGVTFRCRDIDKAIKAAAQPMNRGGARAYVQTLLYLAKGAGVSDGKGGLTWSFARHDGKITLNDRPFTLPGAARN